MGVDRADVNQVPAMWQGCWASIVSWKGPGEDNNGEAVTLQGGSLTVLSLSPASTPLHFWQVNTVSRNNGMIQTSYSSGSKAALLVVPGEKLTSGV